MAITKEGSGSPDLPLKSNFVSGALKCLSKRGPEGRGRTTRPTLNTQIFPHGFMKDLLQVTQTTINSANTAPFQMGESMILGWWQILPHFVEAQIKGVSQQTACFPTSTLCQAEANATRPRLLPSLFPRPSEGESPSVWGDRWGTSACSYLDNC